MKNKSATRFSLLLVTFFIFNFAFAQSISNNVVDSNIQTDPLFYELECTADLTFASGIIGTTVPNFSFNLTFQEFSSKIIR